MIPLQQASLISIVAANLRRLRHQRKRSQEELAELCGYHRTYIGSIERGERNITLSTLEALAESLGVSAVELLSPEMPAATKAKRVK
jgi:transcriptional regulator with XRE-family HTH domain